MALQDAIGEKQQLRELDAFPPAETGHGKLTSQMPGARHDWGTVRRPYIDYLKFWSDEINVTDFYQPLIDDPSLSRNTEVDSESSTLLRNSLAHVARYFVAYPVLLGLLSAALYPILFCVILVHVNPIDVCGTASREQNFQYAFIFAKIMSQMCLTLAAALHAAYFAFVTILYALDRLPRKTSIWGYRVFALALLYGFYKGAVLIFWHFFEIPGSAYLVLAGVGIMVVALCMVGAFDILMKNCTDRQKPVNLADAENTPIKA